MRRIFSPLNPAGWLTILDLLRHTARSFEHTSQASYVGTLSSLPAGAHFKLFASASATNQSVRHLCIHL